LSGQRHLGTKSQIHCLSSKRMHRANQQAKEQSAHHFSASFMSHLKWRSALLKPQLKSSSAAKAVFQWKGHDL
jgi:hypothetical protein